MTTLHTSNDKHEISKQYNKAYTAIIALGGDKAEEIVRFLQTLEMHHTDAVGTLSRIQSALTGNKSESTRWHEQMNGSEL